MRSLFPLLVVGLIAEQQCDAPQTGNAYQRVDNAAECGHLTAEQKCDAVKAKQTHAAPVQCTDDHKDQCNSIDKFHCKTSVCEVYVPKIGFPQAANIYLSKIC